MEHLKRVVELAREIDPQEGVAIFRTNIFIDVMSAVDKGNLVKKESMEAKLFGGQMELGIMHGIDPIADEAGLTLGKGEKQYYVVMSEKGEWFGRYAVVSAKSPLQAANTAGSKFGWLVWDHISSAMPVNMREMSEIEIRQICPIHQIEEDETEEAEELSTGGNDEELEEIIEESGETAEAPPIIKRTVISREDYLKFYGVGRGRYAD